MASHQQEIDTRILPFTEPDYEGSMYRRWLPAVYDALQRGDLCCDTCCAIPAPDGERMHGRGCYVVDSDGGGSDYFDAADILAALALDKEASDGKA